VTVLEPLLVLTEELSDNILLICRWSYLPPCRSIEIPC